MTKISTILIALAVCCYAYVAPAQTLQQVTDAGASTTNRVTIDKISIGDGVVTSPYNLFIGVNDDGINFRNNSVIRGFNFKNRNSAGQERTLFTITSVGNVGIGTSSPTAKLAVHGSIRAKEIRVEAAPWPDYVFRSGYSLIPLDKLERFIKAHKRLPGMPDEAAVSADGVELGNLSRLLVEKLEELTLHIIEQNKAIEKLEEEVKSLKQGKKGS